MIGAGALAAGLMLAQTTPAPTPGTPPTPGAGHRHMRGMRMMKNLNLTGEQKAQAKQIFQTGRENAQPLRAQMKDARKALNDAVKAGVPDSQIDQLSATVGNLSGQLTAMQSKNFAKFYSILTPAQQDQLNAAQQKRQNRMNGFSQRMGQRNAWRSVQQ